MNVRHDLRIVRIGLGLIFVGDWARMSLAFSGETKHRVFRFSQLRLGAFPISCSCSVLKFAP